MKREGVVGRVGDIAGAGEDADADADADAGAAEDEVALDRWWTAGAGEGEVGEVLAEVDEDV